MGVLPLHSVKYLYPLALAEGEGVGTAYEYLAKRLVLSEWLGETPPAGSLLIAGLPEKYGSSLDFHLLAAELGMGVVIADERQEALDKARTALAATQMEGLLSDLKVEYILLSDMSQLSELDGQMGFCVSSEVCQRLAINRRDEYWQRLNELAPAVALFAPNADNPGHTNISGLTGLRLSEMKGFDRFRSSGNRSNQADPTNIAGKLGQQQFSYGYVDLPPFPPGMTRSEEQREKATTGKLEGTAMWGLDRFARLEHFLPLAWRRRQAHIVYALSRIV